MVKPIGERQLALLKDVLFLEQDELHRYSKSFLGNFYAKEETFEKQGAGLYYKGDVPVLLVAHMDTVHKIKPTEETLFFDEKKQAMWSTSGIGADCRAGVFNILDIVSKGYKPHIMLTWDEEIGGVGARALMDHWGEVMVSAEASEVQDAMENVNFAIQFDRRGRGEAVYYDLDNEEFEGYISKFGYKTEYGSYTDICEICPTFGFAGVNVSAGYINEHRDNELMMVDEMLLTQERALAILDDQIKNPKYFKYEAFAFAGGHYGYGSYYSPSRDYAADDLNYGYDYSYSYSGFDDETYSDFYGEPAKECLSCGEALQESFNWTASADNSQDLMCHGCRTEYWQDSADVPVKTAQKK